MQCKEFLNACIFSRHSPVFLTCDAIRGCCKDCWAATSGRKESAKHPTDHPAYLGVPYKVKFTRNPLPAYCLWAGSLVYVSTPLSLFRHLHILYVGSSSVSNRCWFRHLFRWCYSMDTCCQCIEPIGNWNLQNAYQRRQVELGREKMLPALADRNLLPANASGVTRTIGIDLHEGSGVTQHITGNNSLYPQWAI